jgi:hypothetical protein
VGKRSVCTCAAALGADDDLWFLVARLRALWPNVRIQIRGDSGFGVPKMYDVCRELDLSYTFGIGMNSRLKFFSVDLLQQAVEQYEQTGVPQRLFMLVDYQAEGWYMSQPVVINAEAHAQGTNRRAVVTNRPGCRVLPQAVYDEYTMRGESENRNKELKRELAADRLSDHRFLANFFRLYLHVSALNLLIRLRQAVMQALPAEPGDAADLPAEALDEPARRRFFNRRRERDPLGGGFASTWRSRLIKVAAEVVVRVRRVAVRLSGSWPRLDHFIAVCGVVNRAVPSATTGESMLINK